LCEESNDCPSSNILKDRSNLCKAEKPVRPQLTLYGALELEVDCPEDMPKQRRKRGHRGGKDRRRQKPQDNMEMATISR